MLDHQDGPNDWLKHPEVADVVAQSMHFYAENMYDLYAFCIMPNHVHMVFRMHIGANNDKKYPVSDVLGRIKSYSAQKANKILGRTGTFWQQESYDHVVRNQKSLKNIIHYTLENPVKANLASSWREWSHTYVDEQFEEWL
jgi:REP element-mobilizing transposase RayT